MTANGVGGTKQDINVNITIASGTDLAKGFSIVGNTPFDVTLSGGSINTQAIAPNGDIYIGGSFTKVNNINCNNIARWSNSARQWQVLTGTNGNGTNSTVRAIAIDSNNNVYVGGGFTSVNVGGAPGTEVPANYVARWNPTTSTWSALTGAGNGNGTNGNVVAIAIDSSNNVYVGGGFTSVNVGGAPGTEVPANYVARWTPGTDVTSSIWSTLAGNGNGNGTSAAVSTIAIDSSDNVYVGGTFTGVNFGGTPVVSANHVVRWNPLNAGTASAWSALTGTDGNGTSAAVSTIAIDSSDNVYVGGSFASVNHGGTSINARNIVRWNPLNAGTISAWSLLTGVNGNGTGNTVNAIAIDSSNNVYVGGTFTSVNTGGTVVFANRVARWNPLNAGTLTAWSALTGTIGNGTNSTVNSIAIDSSNNVYIGGSFVTANFNNTANTGERAWAITKYVV